MTNTFTGIGTIDQVTGENSNTWGGYANTNFNIEAAILGGNTAVTLTGTDVTVTSVNGTLDQGKNRFYLCTGTLTTNVNLIFPATIEREYVIINGCTGAFTLTAKASGGTGQVVPQGGNMIVWCDGTNMNVSVNLAALGGVTTSNPNIYTAQQNFAFVVLTYGSTVNWNLNSAQKGQLTLTGNALLATPTNIVDGGDYVLRVIQTTGGQLLTYSGTGFNFGSQGQPLLSATAGLTDYLYFTGNGNTSKLDFIGFKGGY
jgi:hypothetical protein